MAKPLFSLTSEPIDVALLKQQLAQASCGAMVSFEGWVRNHNNARVVTRLSYSAYEPMALKLGNRIVQQALVDFSIEGACCVHRLGDLQVGDMAIFVGVAAAHRDAAFSACRAILDNIKADVPIFKEEFYQDSPTSAWPSNNGSL